MFLFNTIFILIIILLLWSLIIGSNKSKINQEKYLEDILQMKYLKNFEKNSLIWYNKLTIIESQLK